MKLPFFLLLPMLVACQTTIHSTAEARAMLSPDGVVLDVPIEDQPGENTCGLACLRSLLAFHKVAPDAVTRKRLSPTRLRESGGVTAGELRDELRRLGFRAALVKGRFDDAPPIGIFSLLRRALPLIVEFVIPDGAGVDAPVSRHFVLVCGFDPERRWIFVMDPIKGLGAIPYLRFERFWEGADRLCLVAAPSIKSE